MTIARGTPGFSGADLANLVNEAALFAARATSEGRRATVRQARDKILMGAERRSMAMSEEERPQHRLPRGRGTPSSVALLLTTTRSTKVTIIPRGGAGRDHHVPSPKNDR